jgi:dipeptidyl aminopeptidase/acylaminoacyl peptidase
MLRNFKLLLIVFALFTLHACKNNEANEIPIGDFFKSPEKYNFKLSPDGKYISYVKTGDKQKQNLFIRSIADGTERLATSFNGFAPRDYTWTYDNQIIFNQSNRFAGESKVFALDVATLKVRNLLSEKKAKIFILNRFRLRPDELTIAMNKRDTVNFDVYKLNIKTGELKTYLINPGKVTEWFPDIDGKIRLVKSSDGVDETILFRPNENSPFKVIIKNNFKNSVKPVSFSCGKKSFYAQSNVNQDKTALVEINVNGKEQKVIFSTDAADVSGVSYSRNKQRLEFASWEGAKPQKHFLNRDVEAIFNDLRAQLGDSNISIVERDSAENKFIIRTETDRKREAYYLYEKSNKKITTLVDNSVIDPEKLCAVQPVSFKASDSLTINGYLTLPKSGKTNLPVVVMPHDWLFGQPTRDSWRYSAEVQFLANRGYAVFQVNYRGSFGYGKNFYSAGFKEQGGKIQQDITDGVNWLIEKKIADPHKIAIMGRRFGGYCGYYGAAHHPELYKCVIVQNGQINFLSYIQDVPQFLKSSVARMYETIGDPENDANKFMEISPVFHPDKIKTPLLVFQDDDMQANIPELRHFIGNLQNRKVPVRYIESLRQTTPARMGKQPQFDRKSRAEANIKMYTEIQNFLDQYMGVKR